MLSIDYIHRFISSLTFTVVVETAVVLLLLWFIFKKREAGIKKIIFTGVFASFATIPYVWFVFPYINSWPRQTSLLYSEPFAFLVEALIYRIFLKIDIRIALTVSLFANLASYLLGPMLRTYGFWIYW
ncbi:MAG: hypothetical protein Q7S48_01270 [bacterium]|nr:hypothetical protein [bacterium]